jgi:PIN domain nuclease of toxin-antitoxin system
VVLDASTLLALINGEPGSELVAAALPNAAISIVNLSEVVSKMIDIGIPPPDAWTEAADLVPTVVDFSRELGHRTALMRPATRERGLSFGDRACLALAAQLGKPALTADHAWQDLAIAIEIRLIR